MKKLSLILTLTMVFAILAFSTSCSLLLDGGNAVYNYRGETYAELCDRVLNSIVIINNK